jgi:hypothetical protein
MKLGEMEFNGSDDDYDKVEELLFVALTDSPERDRVRVEIHTLDPEPWPTERPKDWGVGCWCRISSGQYGICTWLSGDNQTPQVCLVILTAGHWSVGASVQGLLRDFVTSYGPRAEVGG